SGRRRAVTVRAFPSTIGGRGAVRCTGATCSQSLILIRRASLVNAGQDHMSHLFGGLFAVVVRLLPKMVQPPAGSCRTLLTMSVRTASGSECACRCSSVGRAPAL